jgi:hypothetical protein
MVSRLPIRAKDDSPQAQGSAITYARRYALAAIVGLAQIDDDAEAAQARDRKASPAIVAKIAACNTAAELNALYQSLPESARDAATTAEFTKRKKELT